MRTRAHQPNHACRRRRIRIAALVLAGAAAVAGAISIVAAKNAEDGTAHAIEVEIGADGTHFMNVAGSIPGSVASHEPWTVWLKGVRANASTLSHAELDAATDLDRGDVMQLAALYWQLNDRLDLRVVGGCCGTDHEHVAAIAAALGEPPV